MTISHAGIPSLSTLRSFEAAARHESFTHAAEELGVSQGAISRKVKELESVIGVPLFRRIGRNVELTKSGRTLAGSLSADLSNVANTISRAISAGSEDSVIRLAVLPTLANRWLIPRLDDFLAQHPNIKFSIATRDRPFNMVAERFDLAVHYGKQNWPDARLNLLFNEVLVPVSSKLFRAKFKIDRMEDLAKAPLLHLETRPSAWSDWFDCHDISRQGAVFGSQFDQFSMMITSAIHSHGAALLPTYLIEKELQQGSLVRLADGELETENNYYLVSPAGERNPATDAFISWLKTSVLKKRN